MDGEETFTQEGGSQAPYEGDPGGYGDLEADIERILNGEDEPEDAEPQDRDDTSSEDDSDGGDGSDGEDAEDGPDGPEDDDDDDGDEDEDEEDEPEEDAKPPKGSKSDKRFRQLSSRLKAAEERAAEAERRLEELQSSAVRTSEEHPDPEAELEELKDQYRRIMTPAQIMASGQANPLTGQPYTAAEAEAAIANLKQDIQFRMADLQAVVVENMGRARQAEALTEQIRIPLASFIEKYPQLDPDSEKADKDLCDLFQARIDSIMKMDGDMLVGFTQDPQEMVDGFERVLTRMSKMVANEKARTDLNVETVPAKGALDDRSTAKEKSVEDEMLDEFDKAMASMGFGA